MNIKGILLKIQSTTDEIISTTKDNLFNVDDIMFRKISRALVNILTEMYNIDTRILPVKLEYKKKQNTEHSVLLGTFAQYEVSSLMEDEIIIYPTNIYNFCDKNIIKYLCRFIHTFLHEYRHYLQYLEDYKVFDNYKKAQDDYDEYKNQYVEKDADRYAYINSKFVYIRLVARFIKFKNDKKRKGLKLRKDTFNKMKDEHGCGFYHLCSEHDCACALWGVEYDKPIYEKMKNDKIEDGIG